MCCFKELGTNLKFRGGYKIRLKGAPGGVLKKATLPEFLCFPLESQSFKYTHISVTQGQRVNLGEVLAKDPDSYDVPLLCPCGGIVDLQSQDGHIVLKDLSFDEAEEYAFEGDQEHIQKSMGESEFKRYKLLNLGAWECIREAHTGLMPDPQSTPQAVIVSTLRLEPFLARGNVLLREYLRQFTRGLEHIQSLLEYQPIYLVLPKLKADLAVRIKEKIRGYAWVKIIEVPLKYPFDNLTILSHRLGLDLQEGPVWGIHVGGVLAIDLALTASEPCVDRIISLGGSGCREGLHLQLPLGYPIDKILSDYAQGRTVAVEGGILTGRLLDSSTKGIPSDCAGITFIPEHHKREFLAFMRPGFDRQSYSGCFMSSLTSSFTGNLTNAVRGEVRPCVSCNFCEDVCPAGIIPHRLHKLIYQDDIDAVERFRVDLCVDCGLCSFVCPSKIELMYEFQQAKQSIQEEKAAAAKERD